MTATERKLYERVRQRAARLQPEMSRRLLASYDVIRRLLTDRELAEAIRAGHVERLISQLMGDEPLDAAFAPLKQAVDSAVMRSSAQWAGDLPVGARAVAFNMLDESTIAAVRRLDTRVIRTLKDEVRETVRQEVRRSMEAGENPVAAARRIRSLVGMAPNQADAVDNFRRMLETGDSTALSRKLRDRRFDGTLKRALGRGGAGLKPEQVRAMTDAYRKRMIAFNAATNAKTIALDSNRLAQRLSWENAIKQGTVDKKRLRRTWISVGDGRVRPEHAALHGSVTTWDDPYPNGETVPGESTYNCRCIERVTLGDPREITARTSR